MVDCIKNKQNPILIAKEDKQIIGFIIANYNSCFKKAIIENIFVKPEHRGKDIGETLLKRLFEKLTSLKCGYVCFLVEENSSVVIDFYASNGFNKRYRLCLARFYSKQIF